MGKRSRQSELPMLGVLFIAGGFFAGVAVAQPSIDVGQGQGNPNGTATFSVTLATHDAQVAATENDITFDPNTPVAVASGHNCAIHTEQTCTTDANCPVLPEPFNICVGGDNAGNTCTADGDCPNGACSHEPCLSVTGAPACTAQVTGKQAFFSFLPHLCVGGGNAGNTCALDSDCPDGTCTGACTPGTDCTGIRAIVLAVDNLDAIPDGSTLYSCTVNISQDATAGNSYPLTISNESAGDTNQALISGVTGTPGAINVVSGASFVVCDVFPVPGTGGAPFGDGNIRNADIKAQLTMLGSAATSDIQKAADAFPVDSPPTCGGDGNIRNADVKTCLTYLGGKSFVRTVSDSTCSSAAQP
jgi:hypothetical protein